MELVTKFNNWLEEQVMLVYEEKYFLYIMGSLFLLGIVTKWMVVRFYGRLNRKAENMSNPRNVVLRQIKMKFDGIKQVNETVASPVLLVKRHLNKCRVGMLSVRRLNHVINWCSIIAVLVGGAMGLELYLIGISKTIAMTYIAIGGIFAFALEIIDRNIHVKEIRDELACTIVDFLENGVAAREQRNIETISDLGMEKSIEEKEKAEEEIKKHQEEQILNQVIGEFLQ